MDLTAAVERIAALEAELQGIRKELDAARVAETGLIIKNEEQRIVAGWGYIAKDAAGNQVVDHSGDVVRDPSHLEKAAIDFSLDSRKGDILHLGRQTSRLVESFILTPERRHAIGIPDGVLPQVAWFTSFKVDDDKAWEMIRKGEIKAFSVGGKGKRIPLLDR